MTAVLEVDDLSVRHGGVLALDRGAPGRAWFVADVRWLRCWVWINTKKSPHSLQFHVFTISRSSNVTETQSPDTVHSRSSGNIAGHRRRCAFPR